MYKFVNHEIWSRIDHEHIDIYKRDRKWVRYIDILMLVREQLLHTLKADIVSNRFPIFLFSILY